MTKVFHFKLELNTKGYVTIHAQGEAQVADIESMYQEVYQFSQTQQINKVLFQALDVQLNYPMDQFLPLMERLSNYLEVLQVARIVDVDGFRQDLIEVVSEKLDYQLKNFSCPDEAEQWLLGHSF